MWLLDELLVHWSNLVVVLVSASGIYIIVIAYIRISGLRSMSKMSSFDFIMTVAAGAIVGSTALTSESLSEGATALGVLFLLQILIALGRRHIRLGRVVDNSPILLMAGDEILHDNLAKGQLTRSEVYAKLREANVLNFTQVRAVILETTGDVSVLHGDAHLDADLLTGVQGADRIEADERASEPEAEVT